MHILIFNVHRKTQVRLPGRSASRSMKTAYATIKGFEVMRTFRQGQFTPWIDALGGGTEARFINRLFGLYA